LLFHGFVSFYVFCFESFGLFQFSVAAPGLAPVGNGLSAAVFAGVARAAVERERSFSMD
jgi:hypothetical protein